ncbi:MAG: NADP-dependent malic enzyme [Clostridia bacterium]|jgi:malate dehydrogenase (oxaloacetate-decarboxylating)|nr:NADP-dependent malic enzyme [Clostridia bacterium]NLV33020.1 NADP-dependent malic enzyme [Clostridiaceae bacterium]
MQSISESLALHEKWKGKIEVISRVKLDNSEIMSKAYTPGVAEPCIAISEDNNLSYKYTRKHNLVAVITDGTAVLGLGDIGPLASMPVMEGKCALFKEFADIDAFPICIDTKDPDEIIFTIKNISKSFGAINLEDISSPRCFYIEQELRKQCDIPVFHDDQHGTAVVLLAGLMNALRLKKMDISEAKIVINGAGAAGTAICDLLIKAGAEDLLVCDIEGILDEEMENLSEHKRRLSLLTNRKHLKGLLKDAVIKRDVFIGVSKPNLLTMDDVANMNKNPVIFAMANPVPEINPTDAKKAGAFIVGTGRSDFDNQINNVMAFPGIFKGLLSIRAKEISDEMLISAAKAISALVTDEQLNKNYILPKAFDKRLVEAVANAVIIQASSKQ